MKISYIQIILALILINGCDSGYGEGPCSFSIRHSPCREKTYDTIDLNYNFKLLPDKPFESYDTFINQNNGYNLIHICLAKKYSVASFIVTSAVVEGDCFSVYTCRDKGADKNQDLTYQNVLSASLKVSLIWGKESFPIISNMDSAALHSYRNRKDRIILVSQAGQTYLDPNNFGSTQNQTFIPQFNCNGTLIDSVFEIKHTLKNNAIVLEGAYYHRKYGLVGYFLTDKKEVWLRKLN